MFFLKAAPGCARYIQLSPDSLSIGFKYIHKDGSQQPAVINLITKQITFLHNKVSLNGQPTFDNNGNIFFTIGNELKIVQNGKFKTYSMPLYVNFIAVSHNGNFVSFADDDHGIYLFNLTTLQLRLISPPASFYPAFSFNDQYLAYGSNPNLLYIYDIINNTTLGPVNITGFKWSPFENKLLGIHSLAEDFEILKSDVWQVSIPELTIEEITNSSAFESSANYDCKGNYRITYLTEYAVKKIFSDKTSVELFKTNNLKQSSLYPNTNTKADITVPGTVPHVHQVYDTPSWHSGYASCAPTTSIMALAYYNRLPKWSVTVNHGNHGTHTLVITEAMLLTVTDSTNGIIKKLQTIMQETLHTEVMDTCGQVLIRPIAE